MSGYVVQKSYRVDAPCGAFTSYVYLEFIPAEGRHEFLAAWGQATVYPRSLAEALAQEHAAEATEPEADVRVVPVERKPCGWLYPGLYRAMAAEVLDEDEIGALVLKGML